MDIDRADGVQAQGAAELGYGAPRLGDAHPTVIQPGGIATRLGQIAAPGRDTLHGGDSAAQQDGGH